MPDPQDFPRELGFIAFYWDLSSKNWVFCKQMGQLNQKRWFPASGGHGVLQDFPRELSFIVLYWDLSSKNWVSASLLLSAALYCCLCCSLLLSAGVCWSLLASVALCCSPLLSTALCCSLLHTNTNSKETIDFVTKHMRPTSKAMISQRNLWKP